jgi:glycosyltransferase involved in cell wall biosynthesis
MDDMNTFTSPIDTLGAERLNPASLPSTAASSRRAHAAVEIVIPVYNEQHALQRSVRTLHRYLSESFTFPFQITIADNASTDATLDVARALADELQGVEVLYLDRKGRGHALRVAWTRSDAEVLAYMDVDLSTDLSALGELLLPLLQERGDLAIGSRLTDGAQVTRGLKREVISRCYNLLLHALLGVTFSDAQCGFKAGRREAIQALLDDVQDEAWFFDTELLYLAQRRKLAIHEVPVRWVDDPDSRVEIVATAREDLRGVMRLRKARRERHERPIARRNSRALPGSAPAPAARRRGKLTGPGL